MLPSATLAAFELTGPRSLARSALPHAPVLPVRAKRK